jgi:hypothetical protein
VLIIHKKRRIAPFFVTAHKLAKHLANLDKLLFAIELAIDRGRSLASFRLGIKVDQIVAL